MDTRMVELGFVPEPERDCTGAPIPLSDATIQERLDKVVERMRARGLDALVVYGDVEHAGNFAYLAGFFTRFEEGLLVIAADGSACFVLGNENRDKADKARIDARVVHAPILSLPNQPQAPSAPLPSALREAGVQPGMRVGLAGWKLFTAEDVDASSTFDVPAFIVDALREAAGSDGALVNATGIFIGADGARTANNANEVAHYEFGAALASDCMLDAMDALGAGVSEMRLGDTLVRHGQHTSVVTIAASGPRFVQANMFPTANRVKWGDPVALTVGYAGGLSSRAGFAVSTSAEMPREQADWLEKVAAPYFAAYVRWLERIRVGMTGGELFDEVERVLPRATYGWSLCPGHLTAEEEWLCSPVYEGSSEVLTSGMIFQIDIIPSVPGYGGVSAESTVALADEGLKRDIRSRYPGMWERMERRRAYITEVLGIALSPDVLPMCSTVAYLRPYLLNHRQAFSMQRM